MIKHITYFHDKTAKKLKRTFLSYSSDMTKIAELVQVMKDCMIEFGLCMLPKN